MDSKEFDGIKLVGGESLPVRMKIPRNQISVGSWLESHMIKPQV